MRDHLYLEEEQCRTTFPTLFREVDDAVARGNFVFEKSNPDYQGLVQGRIKDGKLYVLSAAPDTVDEIHHERTAILSQVHRALLTSPSPLPDIHFAYVINDSPKNNSWAFARPNKPSTYNTWLMPAFAFWSWPSPALGAMDDILNRIESVEKELAWDKKNDKAVWRGTPWFNPLGHPTLRQDLLKAARGKEWADVAGFNMSNGMEATNILQIEDFCRYKYVVYTEGVTYSGRLPYHQACGSVLLTPPLTYLTHTAWLMRPIHADYLLALFDQANKTHESPAFNSPRYRPPPALLPSVKGWREANAIYVDPKFSNLESVILFLRSHPDVAKRIAQNQRDAVVMAGYLSTAAETCYWRGLIRGWASVAKVDNGWGEELGERFETWILRQVTERRDMVRGKNSRSLQ
ncbi:hypothetical protein BU26DRAFT_437108 [Trematosphaeria pertusa]|uniref:Glycosyl transferase CAP10 domain-containing protein n=1 Tax=Trematosphaeria pertusa TaxID=390896 RepID=A0A6A6HZE6_9PLEO|nr:uncharacterized protein BU26DRAFT_437108 [Trematosphaeria pertusa]KAF2243396.1 hypothetical protein BU26DRAFT_437108 [Trematosphaeria pertusa]